MTDISPRLAAALADRYRLERELGQGGMATVFLAADLKHDRKVALKVLKPELAAVLGAERFVAEIRTTAALQHPHILPLFDSGTADGFLYYVMPFIDGETLRSKLDRETQLGIDEAVRLTAAIADALHYAHRHGVVHRDIKPENILLHDGRPMVADFGIALALSAAAGGRMTETGMSLGTPHYMSPEQATAEKEITARADVYSLGAVLYEMLTGNPPHTGASAQQIIMKIVTEEAAPVTKLRKAVPPHVAAAVATALEKLPADRFATAAEFAAALGDAAFATRRMQARAAPGGASPGHVVQSRVTLGVAIASTVALLASLAAWRPWASAAQVGEPIVLRYQIDLPDSARPDPGESAIPYAADGSAFAYRSAAGLQIYYVDRLAPIPVTGGRRGTYPFFSPDGRWLGFRDGARMLKVQLAGGSPIVICDSCVGYQADWGADDTLRYHTQAPDNPISRTLMAVPAAGGTPRLIAQPDSGSGIAYRYPILVPGTRTVLFTLRSGDTDRLAALDLDSGAITEFEQTGGNPRWVDAGYVVLANRDLSLVAVPFDARKGRPSGPPVTIARDVLVGSTADAFAGVSRTGSILYVHAIATTKRGLAVVSRDGRATPLAAQSRGYEGPRLSPDGRRLAIGIAENAGGDVWVFDLAQGGWSRITTSGLSERPVWTPDGRRLVYANNADLWWIAADGSGRPDSLLVAAGNRHPTAVTPDNRSVVFRESGSANAGLRRLAFDSAPAAEMVLPAAFEEAAPDLSPNGRWLAYQSEETGRNEVYVRPFPGPGARVPISVSGGTEPAWSRDGQSLYYRAGDSIMVASLADSDGLTVLDRQRLFVGPYLRGALFREYDVSADGQRFYLVTGRARESSFIAIHHFFERLAFERRRAR